MVVILAAGESHLVRVWLAFSVAALEEFFSRRRAFFEIARRAAPLEVPESCCASFGERDFVIQVHVARVQQTTAQRAQTSLPEEQLDHSGVFSGAATVRPVDEPNEITSGPVGLHPSVPVVHGHFVWLSPHSARSRQRHRRQFEQSEIAGFLTLH